MRSIFIFLIIIASITTPTLAQEVLFQGGLGICVGDLTFAPNNKQESPGYGGSFTYFQKINSSVSMYGTTGVYFFEVEEVNEQTRIIPLMLGLRIQLGAGGFLPYLGAELGYSFISYKTVGFFDEIVSNNTNAFDLGVLLGIKIPITHSFYWDFSTKYNTIFSSYEYNSIWGLYTGFGIIIM